MQSKSTSDTKIPIASSVRLSEFSKLLLIRTLCQYHLVEYIGTYVRNTLGEEFDDISPSKIEDIYLDSDSTTPIIFILSEGVDPSQGLMKFCEQTHKKMDIISLG